MAHPQLASHLEHVAHKSAEHFHDTFKGVIEKDLIGPMQDHDLVHEKNHEHIVSFLTDFMSEHPHLAYEFASKMKRTCERVLAKEELKDHHDHAQVLSGRMQQFHDDMEECLGGLAGAQYEESIIGSDKKDELRAIDEQSAKQYATDLSKKLHEKISTVLPEDRDYFVSGSTSEGESQQFLN